MGNLMLNDISYSNNGTGVLMLNGINYTGGSDGGGGGGNPYTPVSEYDVGRIGYYSDISSPNAPSGTVAIVYQKVDLTDISNVNFLWTGGTTQTNTGTPQRIGVSQTLPETWADVQSNYDYSISSASGTQDKDVSALSGEYYVWYAGSLTYNNAGWVRAFIGFDYS